MVIENSINYLIYRNATKLTVVELIPEHRPVNGKCGFQEAHKMLAFLLTTQCVCNLELRFIIGLA